ncbi:MAG TPA: hypothetical protein VGN23_16670 [Verrucomicrobiae bacterium]|jgi:hypothetical protein
MTHQKNLSLNPLKALKWPWLCGLLALALVQAACAADALYENDGVVDVTIPPDLFAIPDATNFVNTDWFEINFGNVKGSVNVDTFESEDTLNYTNEGVMVMESTIDENPDGLILAISPGCGYDFDHYNTQSGLVGMAASFYNNGSIRANSQVDFGVNSLIASTVGKCAVNATNIVNPGTIDLGEDSLMTLTGQNIDLTRGTLTIENTTTNLYGLGAFGVDTNKDWDPAFDLGPNSAVSSLPFIIDLTNSTPFFQVDVLNNGTNVVYRSAFVEDYSTPSVPFNVYFDSASTFGGGAVTVEWIASYINYATGTTFSNYLYLNDDYVLGASTNVALIGTPGYPDNFIFTESPVKRNPGTQASPGFINVFPDIINTNAYAYVQSQLISASTPTNASSTNPSGALTNLPARIQINASQDLNLSYVNINQPNYLSLNATSQFDGNVGSSIVTSYADFNLGVTNGFLVISNLMAPYVPVWSGLVDAWSTRFLVADTNAMIGTNIVTITNDYRVLIVGSQLNPIAPTYVANLVLHSTNVVLSDTINLLTKLSIDAQNFTLTTNPIGTGAESPAGELNWQNIAILFSNSLPNLVNLTNNGVISANNLVSLGKYKTLGNIINNGTLIDNGTAFWVTNFQSSGNIQDGVGAFQLNASMVNLTNGIINAVSNNISIAATIVNVSNATLNAGSALTLNCAVLSDGFPNGTTGLTNANNWSVGADALSGFHGIYLQNGINLQFPSIGSGLLGTSITSTAQTNKLINNVWAAQDYGAVNAGFTNNAAIGQLILNAQSPGPGAQFYFTGTGVSNAIYVDHLVLDGYASYLFHSSTNSIPALAFNTNIVIYYADATAAGVGDVSFLLNGFNHDANYPAGHLRWVPSYLGYYSSTNVVNAGTTNVENIGLMQNGYYTYFTSIEPSQMDFMNFMTNNPPNTMVLSWTTVPLANNFVYYSTNMVNWQLLTNAYLMTNPFVSPGIWPGVATNVMVLDPIIIGQNRFYKVNVTPDESSP